MQDGLLPLDDQGVTRIVSPLESGDHIRIFRIEIDDLSFSFITPLGSDHHHVCHEKSSLLSVEENRYISSCMTEITCGSLRSFSRTVSGTTLSVLRTTRA